MGDATTVVPAKKRAEEDGPDPLVGRMLNDRFRIVEPIARGGMGKVYVAEQQPMGRRVALKVLSIDNMTEMDPDFRRRFFLEASICAKLKHPNTVTVFDYGQTEDDILYIVMELLEGQTVRDKVRGEGALPVERAVHITKQVARSLAEAHATGVIHRDLKPANVFLVDHEDDPDFVKVLDFGLVKDIQEGKKDLTKSGVFMGSPRYMSPEQIQGERVDPRTDIYSLGVIFYEMLTGRPPFDGPSQMAILTAHMSQPVPPPTAIHPELVLGKHLQDALLHALAKKVEDRFESMDDFVVALERAEVDPGNPVESLPDYFAAGERTRRALRRQVLGGEGSGSDSMADELGRSSTDSTTVLQRAPAWKRALSTIFVALVGALVAVLAIRFMPSGSSGEDRAFEEPVDSEAEPSGTEATAPAGASSVMDPAAEAVAPRGEPRGERAGESFRLVLYSTPPGAMVHIGERTFGPTPVDVELFGDDMPQGETVTFQFRLDGHRDYTVSRLVRPGIIRVNAEMVPTEADEADDRSTRRGRNRIRRRQRSGGSEPANEPEDTTPTDERGIRLEGYRPEPY